VANGREIKIRHISSKFSNKWHNEGINERTSVELTDQLATGKTYANANEN